LEAGRAAIAAGAVQAGIDCLRRACADAAARGMNASDMGDYPAALQHLQGSVERARRAANHRQQAWSLANLARAHLLRDERSQAAATLAGSLELVREQRWMAFLPWPQALKGELDLRAGHLDAAGDELEHAWALACQLGDPCWEGMAARGLGLLHATRGDHATATAWLAEAHLRCNRVTDRYQWVSAYVLDASVAAALDRHDQAGAHRLVDTLASLAARGDMRELVVRAHLHRSRLGDPAALASARLLAAGIDNPALTHLLDGVQAG
jgi:tetratricopeptide (TPR) repeat protein